MEKGHSVPPGAGSGVFVDELDSLSGQDLEIGLQVFGPVGDVVKAWAPAVQKPADGCVGAEGLEELDGAGGGGPGALGFQGLGEGGGLARKEFEEAASLV
jgi:hypothetical protein